jgi:hypothetical protein
MKQWLYYSWVKFNDWVLFTSWRISHSEEDRAELVKFYKERRFRTASMDAYVKLLSNVSEEENARLESMNLYIGDLKVDRFEIVNEYYKHKAEEEKSKSD